jgi:lipopolysaccharide/colanic/teichoic acid biosynthesis glycosyltransferase
MIKRLFDATLSGVGLLVSFPLWIVIPVAIKLEDGGPVFFPQARVGLDGRVFKALKFRSMVTDADRRFGPMQARENDPRITRIGRVLRATAMDELPQLWNILVGDMSFVGPRPLMPGELKSAATAGWYRSNRFPVIVNAIAFVPASPDSHRSTRRETSPALPSFDSIACT